MQIYIAMRDLNCEIQIMHRDVNLHVHTVQNTVIRMIIQIVHCCSRVKTVLAKSNTEDM